MGQIKRFMGMAVGASIVLVATSLMSGCSSTPSDPGGNDGDYNLVVVLEKNLESGQDVVFVKFTRDASAIDDGVVVVDGDSIATSSVSGKGTKTYATPRWLHSEKIQIAAVDAGESFVYRDSVVIPDGFVIDHVVPANHILRPSDGSAQVSWTASIGAANYLISVDSRNAALNPVGFAGYNESQFGLSQEILPSAFRDTFGNLIEDVYDLKVVAYFPNFIARDGAPYKTLPGDDIRTPIINENLTGAIAALVLADRDTLLVETQ
jgi:hypothetical protein